MNKIKFGISFISFILSACFLTVCYAGKTKKKTKIKKREIKAINTVAKSSILSKHSIINIKCNRSEQKFT